jgi:hypothetical protein
MGFAYEEREACVADVLARHGRDNPPGGWKPEILAWCAERGIDPAPHELRSAIGMVISTLRRHRHMPAPREPEVPHVSPMLEHGWQRDRSGRVVRKKLPD